MGSSAPTGRVDVGRREGEDAAMADEALTLLLVDVGRNKIGVIKVVREVTGIDLAGAKAAAAQKEA
ncbi:MAG: ribosomal protein L7/L12, partial [Acidimicrobiales bacterium]|nr:ribosomal protein L7/L12 [Acidimicrobiales bacterium]